MACGRHGVRVLLLVLIALAIIAAAIALGTAIAAVFTRGNHPRRRRAEANASKRAASSAAHSRGRGRSEGPILKVGHQQRKAEEGSRIMTFIRASHLRRRGVAAVEFALILPVLALLLFGVLEFTGGCGASIQVFQGAKPGEGASVRLRRCRPTGFSDCEIQPSIDAAADPLQA